jgi:hypothetical protein
MLLVAFTAFVRFHLYIVSDLNQRTTVTNTSAYKTQRDNKETIKLHVRTLTTAFSFWYLQSMGTFSRVLKQGT